MTESELRAAFVKTAESFFGYSEANEKHRQIIDMYNAHKPLAAGYAVKYTDAWCATFASVIAIKMELTSIIPTECSCPRQIELWKKKGRWIEDDAYVPSPGDYIYYAWKDGTNYAATDNTNVADHVGIVVKVTPEKTLVIIEGNYKDAVSYRTIGVNSKYIRGYGIPDFASACGATKEDPNTMEYVVKPVKIAIYANTTNLTMSQIKAKTGCDAIMNGGLFNGLFKPVCRLKIGGNVLADDGYKYWGFGWNGNGADICMTEDMPGCENYICCVCMVRDFQPQTMVVNKDMTGARQRTALGLMDDGFVWMYATLNPTTPEQLQKIAIAAGCKYAIMLDGGASTQCIFPHGSLYSKTRPQIQNYILLWTSTPEEQPAKTTDYPEPTRYLSRGATGNDVKWLQSMLNKVGAQLTVDGDLGAKTVAALMTFQTSENLEKDGICGPQTVRALKNAVSSIKPKDICPYDPPTRLLRMGMYGEDVKWLQWKLNQNGNKLTVDGEFGKNTSNALYDFQISKGLMADRVCGPATIRKLEEV